MMMNVTRIEKSLAPKVTNTKDIKLEVEDDESKINEDMKLVFQKLLRHEKHDFKLHK